MRRREFVKGLGVLGAAGLATAICPWPGALGTGWAAGLPEQRIQAVLDAHVGEGALPGVILGVKTPWGSFFGASGLADLATTRPLTAEDQIRIASTTKTITATLVLMLVDEGLLGLDTRLGEILPGAVPNADSITLTQLLNHTAGVHDHEEDPGLDLLSPEGFTKDWSAQEILAFPNAHGPDFAPGSQWKYSNCGYYLLGLVVEKVTGSTVEEQTRARIFDPLGMTRTRLSRTGYLEGRFTGGDCLVLDEATVRDMTHWNMSWDWTAGGGVTMAADMLRFAEGLFAGRLLRPATLERMCTPSGAARDRIPGTVGYGFGLNVWTTDRYFGEPCFGHDGANGGTHAKWAYYPEAGRGIFLATNRMDYSDAGVDAIELLKQVMQELVPLLREPGAA